VPGFAVLLGLVEWVAFAVGGDPEAGAIAFILAAFGALLLLGGRANRCRMRAKCDERWAVIDLRATALTGLLSSWR
jgi:hypothetical protein